MKVMYGYEVEAIPWFRLLVLLVDTRVPVAPLSLPSVPSLRWFWAPRGVGGGGRDPATEARSLWVRTRYLREREGRSSLCSTLAQRDLGGSAPSSADVRGQLGRRSRFHFPLLELSDNCPRAHMALVPTIFNENLLLLNQFETFCN